jgi:hypothetical protein
LRLVLLRVLAGRLSSIVRHASAMPRESRS